MFTTPDGEPLGFAGLWEVWDDRGKEEEPLYTCTIITTDASDSIKDIHSRMPVILTPKAYQDWIKADTPVDSLKEIISNHAHKDLVFRPVSKDVNSVQNNYADLIKKH
jgi:putative SOS response-associated peptidase YedK